MGLKIISILNIVISEDVFIGCGTTITIAQKVQRKWDSFKNYLVRERRVK